MQNVDFRLGTGLVHLGLGHTYYSRTVYADAARPLISGLHACAISDVLNATVFVNSVMRAATNLKTRGQKKKLRNRSACTST